MPLPLYYLKVILTSRMACIVSVMTYREESFRCSLNVFSKGPRGLPYVFITGKDTTLEAIYGPTLADHGVFVLGVPVGS